MRDALNKIADDVAGGRIPVKSVWTAINGAGAYGAFELLRRAADVSHLQYLPNVLKARYREPAAMATLLRAAAAMATDS